MRTIEDFLRSVSFMTDDGALSSMAANFRKQMRQGLNGEGSSLLMLPSYLPLGEKPRTGEALVMDAGGTHLRTARLRLDENGVQVLAHRERPMPGTQGKLDRNTFFRALSQDAAALMRPGLPLGICFSFSAEIQPDGDARVMFLDKELQVDGLAGELVGQGVCEAMRALGAPSPSRVRVLNDTTAALLGALAASPKSAGGACIGMILGTGFNCCYGEENRRIGKADALRSLPGRSIVNIEAGGYDGAPASFLDFMLRMATEEKNQNPLEKMFSGAYQGMLMQLLVDEAAQYGCFAPGDEWIANDLKKVTAADVSALVNEGATPCGLNQSMVTPATAGALRSLGEALITRAAGLAAQVLLAVACQSGAKTGDEVFLAIEGTTYWKNPRLQQLLDAHLAESGMRFRIVHAENANLTGAAMAAIGQNDETEND